MASPESDGAEHPAPARQPKIRTALRRVLRNDQLVLLVLALLAGVLAAYGAIAFRELYLATRLLAFGTQSEELYSHAAALPAWQRVLAPALGGLFIGLFVRYVMPDRRPRGVGDVMEAVALHSGNMSLRAAIGGAVVSATSIGVGASVGREGPVVHLGASLSSMVARQTGLSRSQTVTLLGCGVAAAVSSSFNAPIAGVFFALEVVIGHYALSAFAPIVLASVVGTMISRAQFGDFPAFSIPDHSSVSYLEFPAFAILGVLCAVLAIAFMRGVAITQKVAQKIPAPVWSRPMMGGILVGLIAIPLPHVLGIGYGSTDAALKELFPLELLIALVVAKTAATAISVGSGFGGGVFSPSLFMGAMLGGAFGIIATAIFPEYSSGVTGYTLVGMGAVAGSVLGAPISTILIIFELTADYALTIAVMIGVVFASIVTHQFYFRSFFLWQLSTRGIDLEGGREAGLLESIRVRDLMSGEYSTVLISADIATIREELMAADSAKLFVLADDGTLAGTITLPDLPEEAFDASPDNPLTAADLVRPNPPVAQAHDSITDTLHLMHESGEEHIGVVDTRANMKLVGFVHQVDVILVYNRALLKARQEERGHT